MNRIAAVFNRLKSQGEKALIPFITAGDPDLEATRRLALEMAGRGADILELGIPFSDPLADGPTIQAASNRAVRGGTHFPEVLELAGKIRQESDIPLILMGYYNPILQYGLERAAADAAAQGVDGFIIPDLPPEEADPWRRAAAGAGVAAVFLAAPTSGRERLQKLGKITRGFLYYVSVTGITGVLFINLDRKDPETPDYSPKITFVSEYPVIASRPSDIRRIFTMVEDFAAKLKDIDAVGLAAETKQTVKDIGNLARSREIKNILANVEKTTANLAYVTGNTGKKSKEAGTLQDTLADARGVLKEAKGMVAFLTKEIEGLKLGELTGKTAHIVTELQGTTQNLRQASETLEMLLERVYERPPDLLFGKPPRKRWNE